MESRERKTPIGTVLGHLWVPFAVLIGLLILDIAVKRAVMATMTEGEVIEVIHNFFNIHYIRNPGMAFGLGAGGRWIFVAVTAVAVPAVTYLLVRWHAAPMLLRIALAMVISGGIGNFIDRAAWGKVTDMFEIVYFGHEIFGSTSFAIFNVADMALVIGAILLIVYFLFVYYDQKDPKAVARHDQKLAARAEKKAKKADARDARAVESVDAFLARMRAEHPEAAERWQPAQAAPPRADAGPPSPADAAPDASDSAPPADAADVPPERESGGGRHRGASRPDGERP